MIARMLLLAWVQLYLLGPELTKLPILLMHYQEHRADDGDLFFATFLDLHYAENGAEVADHDGHENLPYHHHHGGVVDHGAVKIHADHPSPEVNIPALMGECRVGALNDDAELSGHPRALLQPPKSLA